MSADLPAGIRLRTATEADLADVARLLDASGVRDERLASHVGDYYVAEADGRVVGAIGLDRLGDDALLRSACVDAEWRGRGVASALVEHALTEAALEALDHVYLVTASADRFFARFGFAKVGETDLPLAITRVLARDRARAASAIPMRLQLSAP